MKMVHNVDSPASPRYVAPGQGASSNNAAPSTLQADHVQSILDAAQSTEQAPLDPSLQLLEHLAFATQHQQAQKRGLDHDDDPFDDRDKRQKYDNHGGQHQQDDLIVEPQMGMHHHHQGGMMGLDEDDDIGVVGLAEISGGNMLVG